MQFIEDNCVKRSQSNRNFLYKLGLLVLTISFLMVSLLFADLFAQSNNHIACGEQSGTWNYDTVFVNCDIIIPENEVLEILSGTTVLFNDHYKITINGALQAKGTAASPVRFTVGDTTGFADIHSTAGGWGGIRMDEVSVSSDSTLFEFCTFKYGKAVVDSVYRFGGAICIREFDKIKISDCIFENNLAFYRGGAIYAEKSDMFVRDCLFIGNFAGNDSLIYGYGGAIKQFYGEPIIQHCEFYENGSTGIGGAVSFEYADPLMVNCIFQYNYSGLGGAIGYLRSTPTNINVNILIIDNQALFFGGGIANVAASPMFTNTTIAGNYAAMGGGLYCNEASNPKMFNTILWDNTAGQGEPFGSQLWLWDTDSEPAFYNCAIQFGIAAFGGSGTMFEGPYVDCIEDDPLFIDTWDNNYRLNENSPCVNTGMTDTTGLALPWFDLGMDPRISGGRLDMGSYEFQEAVAVKQYPAQTSDLVVFPQPLVKNSLIQFNANSASRAVIELRNLNGELISSCRLQLHGKAIHAIEINRLINLELLPPSVYLIGFRTDYESKYIKVVR